MGSLARTIRRATARRTGKKKPDRDHGVMVSNSIEGRPVGAKCFDWENRISPNRVVVHFRHPTKKRTDARVCQATYTRKVAA